MGVAPGVDFGRAGRRSSNFGDAPLKFFEEDRSTQIVGELDSYWKNRRLPTTTGFRLAPNPNGPVDHEVPMLRIESGEKKLIGVVLGYACHNTALGPTRQVNGDYDQEVSLGAAPRS